MKGTTRVKTLVVASIAVALTAVAVAQAGRFKVLHEFKGSFDGQAPNGYLVQDSSGNLYGTTMEGGAGASVCTNGCGTVFELSPNGSGGWTMKTLHRFLGKTDGGAPAGAIVMDASGNLYGTNLIGGIKSLSCKGSCGTVFELSPDGSGGWTETTIFTFANTNTSDGARPWGLIQDATGNLYGVAQNGGSGGSGVVYKLSQISEGAWRQTVLHEFSGGDGADPTSKLLLDADGNLLGTTFDRGVVTGSCEPENGCGGAFEISPAAGGGWSFAAFAIPNINKGFEPRGNVVKDASGNLFSTAFVGGINSDGVVFKLSPVSGGGWTESLIHIFDGAKGAYPQGLTEDSNGGFYGVATGGGNASCTVGCGMIYDLTPRPNNGWVETILHRFNGTYDGAGPDGHLMVDGSGNIFGAAQAGGSTNCFAGCGTIFEISAPAPVGK